MHKHILYLASGSSRRFGGNKLLHEWQGKPLFLYGLETLEAVAAECADCSVTVISRYASIRETAEKLAFRAVDAPDSEKGISHTIRAGIESLGKVAEGDYLLFVVADQPRLTAASVERMLALAETGILCGCAWADGAPGNPTLFSARLIPELLALEGDTGGRAVLRRHECACVSVDSPEELEDIDTREALG